MILLNRDSTNKSVFTLFEKTTLSPVYYLFEFIDEDTNTSKLFTGVDISTNKPRYNEFVIELTTNGIEDLLNSVINLPIIKEYTEQPNTKSVYNG